MECFAQRYHANNPGIFHDSDTAYLLAFSLIMLNTDAHNPAIKHKMSKKAFVTNNTGIRGKDDIPVSYLEMLYDRIVQNEIKMEADGLFTRAAHKGWLEKRSTTNKWQKRWFVLKNNCLYYFIKPEDDDPRVIIPLEGLLIRKIESQAPSSSTPIHPSCIFEIVDPYARTIKSVKLQSSKGPSEGGHERFVLMAANPEEADEWVNILQNNVLGNPLLSLIKKRKSQVSRKSAAVGLGRHSPAFSPPALSSSSASSSSSSHKPAAMLPSTIDPSDIDINLSPPPSPPKNSTGTHSPTSHSPRAENPYNTPLPKGASPV
jgi:cytohesin